MNEAQDVEAHSYESKSGRIAKRHECGPQVE